MTESIFGIDITLARIVLVLGVVALIMLARLVRVAEEIRTRLSAAERPNDRTDELLAVLDTIDGHADDVRADVELLRQHFVGQTEAEGARAIAEWDRENLPGDK